MLESLERKRDRRVLKFALLTLAALVCLIAFVQLTCRTPADSAALIEKSSLLKEHDRFCLGAPRPADFVLEAKMVGGNSFTRSISYRYQSDKLFAEVTAFYEDQLRAQGWAVSDRYDQEMSPIPKFVSFEKDSYRLTLEHVSARGGGGPAEYAVTCSKITR
jgi:hypothetical protein